MDIPALEPLVVMENLLQWLEIVDCVSWIYICVQTLKIADNHLFQTSRSGNYLVEQTMSKAFGLHIWFGGIETSTLRAKATRDQMIYFSL